MYPAIAVARELLDKDWNARILFITTKKGCGVEVLKREEFEYRTIVAGGMKKKSLRDMLVSLVKLPLGFLQALFHVALFRPDVALGAGGYVTGPALAAAWFLKTPVLIHEQNALPGAANRMLARIAGKIALAFPETVRYFPSARTAVTGNPVRKEFFEIKPKVKEVERQDLFTVLAFGGSQGAHAINMAMLRAVPRLGARVRELRILHQTGKADYEEVERGYREMGVLAEVKPFIYDMFDAFRLADLVICRAGAMTLSELAAAGKPAVLIPLPTAADNHQEVNARALEKKNAAEVLFEDELLPERLAAKIAYYMENPLALLVVGDEVKKFSRPDAASRIASLVEELAAK